MTATVVIVTFNRLDILKKTLNAYLDQIKKFDTMIIVDNHSTDGTAEFLKGFSMTHENIYVEYLTENIGGAGGFSRGIELALEKTDNEWIFVADDDAIPEPEMFRELERGYAECEDKEGISAICTSVINHGKFDIAHRWIYRKTWLRLKVITTEKDFSAPFYCDGCTFVGLMVKTQVVRKIGFPNERLFIYHDDTEYSFKIRESGKIRCIPTARIVHDLCQAQKKQMDWRNYYAVRNELYFLKTYFPPRYYRFKKFAFYIKHVSLLSILLKHRDKAHRTMYRAAISDGKHGKLGIHPIYRP